MLRAGLIKKSDNNQANYTYFRDRVMFPITDAKGRVIAFGGRIMGDGQPKYLNSPETEIFNKGENLYGLSQAISSIREFDTAILVEGYMDVISLVKAGIPYAVAPLGTALTEKQVMKLWHYTSEPAVCFDNDTAGANAMIKSALRTLPILKAGYSVKFTNVVGAKDPDEFIVARGKEAFLELDKKNLDEILWNYLVSNYRFETPEHKAKFEMEIEALLNNIKDEKVKGYYLGDFKRRLKERIYGKRLYKKDLSNNSVSKVSIKSGVNEAKSLIAYCLLFPEIAKNFVEDYYNYQVLKIELDEINNYLNKVMDILTLKKDISESELKEELEKSNLNHIYTAVSSEIEIITRKFKRKFKDESEKQKLVKQDFGLRLTNYKIFAINKEISMIKSQANNEDFLNDGTLWERYVFLKSEKEKLENLNF
ncbi:MAG: DNA primase [bacterium ADurb.BinA186]|nr:MAG: DNA primase [bacterium ADurb.BinA186]